MTGGKNKDRPKSLAVKFASGGVTISQLAEHLNLTKGPVSAVLNDSPYAKSIPQRTKDRILAAAVELNYQPNLLARYLRQKRSFSIGIVVEEIGDPYSSSTKVEPEFVVRPSTGPVRRKL